MDLLVGCPVLARGWILDAWLDHLVAASERAGVVPSLIFAGNPGLDRDSFDVIEGWGLGHLCVTTDDTRSHDRRDWTDTRYQHMVKVRNLLLAGVRSVQPKLFLSLDSDILLHPDGLSSMLDALVHDERSFDAMGGFALMSPGYKSPSFAMITRTGAMQRRLPAEGVMKVDVIMACKLMGPLAYAVDYAMHPKGEDLGWGLAAKAAGVRLGWDGRVKNKHVLEPARLGKVDPRIGW